VVGVLLSIGMPEHASTLMVPTKISQFQLLAVDVHMRMWKTQKQETE
jgi:hypothetical protein